MNARRPNFVRGPRLLAVLLPLLLGVACEGGLGDPAADVPIADVGGADTGIFVPGDAGSEDVVSGEDLLPELPEDAADSGGPIPPDAVVDAGPAPRIPSFPESYLGQEVAWTACPLYGSDDGAECADVTVPWRWAEPDGETLTLRVMRYRPNAAATTEIWMLQGGPAPGVPVMSFAMQAIEPYVPRAAFYTLDHRGTGASSWVGCPEQESPESPDGSGFTDEEWDACLAHVTERWPPPDVFRTTEAALDVAFLVQLVSEPAIERRFVYGVSYGTTWTHRLAQVAPDLADGFVLDSVALPTAIHIDRYDEMADRVGRDLLGLCGADPVCGEKLGADPAAFALGALAKLADDAHCPALTEAEVGPDVIRRTLVWMGMNSWARPLIAPLLYRVDRCDARDGAAAVGLLENLGAMGDAAEGSGGNDSPLLRQHVLMSELSSPEPRSLEEVEAFEETLIFSSGADLTTAALREVWPVYAVDEFHGAWAPADVPLLMMNGTLDLQTTRYSQGAVRENLAGPHQTFVEIPWANHGTIIASPVATPDAPDCGLQIFLDFLTDPLVPPRQDCLDDLVPPDLSGTSSLAPFVFHEDDLFENVDAAHECALPQDYLAAPDGLFVAFVYDGPIVDAQDFRYGVGEFTARLSPDEAPFDASRFGSYSYYQSYPGMPASVTISATAAYATEGTFGRRYTSINVAVPVATLESLRDGGESLLLLTGEDGARVSVSEIREAVIDGHAYAMVCDRALRDPEAGSSSLHLCPTAESDFAVGEPLQLAGNVVLTSDPGLLRACYCVIDGAAYTSCDVFDGPDAAKAAPLAGLRRPVLPLAPRAPERPRTLVPVQRLRNHP